MSEYRPDPDLVRVGATPPRPEELVTIGAGTALGRIHFTGGSFPSQWFEFRHWGPTSARFDHHSSDPPGPDPVHGVMYVTIGDHAFNTALAEVFQDSTSQTMGPIDRTYRRPTFTRFDTASDFTVLDLDSGWITRAGGNQAIRTGSRKTAQKWARAIHSQFAVSLGISGLLYGSSIWGPGRCVALWELGAHALPTLPTVSRVLDDPSLDVPIAHAAAKLCTIVTP